MVRAKFTCTEKHQTQNGNNIVLAPVVTGSPENDSFFKYTPGGELKLSVLETGTSDKFEVGKEYYLDFTPAE